MKVSESALAVMGDNEHIPPSLNIKSLSFSFPDGSNGLKDVTLDLPPRSRTLLVGGNYFPLSSSPKHDPTSPPHDLQLTP